MTSFHYLEGITMESTYFGNKETEHTSVSQSEARTTKVSYPRYWDTLPSTSGDGIRNAEKKKNLTLCFSPRSGNVIGNSETKPPLESDPEYWTSSDVQCISNDLLVKRQTLGKTDNIVIAKVHTGITTFKFPTAILELAIPRMEKMLQAVVYDENGNMSYPGITEVTPYSQLSASEFWEGEFAIKLMQFKMRLFLADYKKPTLSWRLLNEVEPDRRRVYSSGQWNGPTASISMSS